MLVRSGGVLGLGGRETAVDMERVQWDEQQQVTADLTQEDL